MPVYWDAVFLVALLLFLMPRSQLKHIFRVLRALLRDVLRKDFFIAHRDLFVALCRFTFHFNDPRKLAIEKLGGYYSSERFELLLTIHQTLLGNVVGFMVDYTHITAKVAVAIVETRSQMAETIRSAKNHYVIAINASLFVRLYESFSVLVRDDAFCSTVGRIDYTIHESSLPRRKIGEAVGRAFGDLEDQDRASLLLGLVSCALEYLVLHEFAHIRFRHLEVVDIQSKKFGLSLDEFARWNWGSATLHQLELDADCLATDASLSTQLIRGTSISTTNSVPVGLFSGLGVDDKLTAFECWLFCVSSLMILTGPIAAAGDVGSHPPWTYRLQRVLRRSKEIRIAPQQFRSIEAQTRSFSKIADWLSKADLPREQFMMAVNEYEKNPYVKVFESSFRTDLVDQFFAVTGLNRYAPGSGYFKITKALQQLSDYLLRVRGTSEEVVKSKDFKSMRNSVAFKTLVSSPEVKRLLQENWDQVLTISPDYRIGLIMFEVAKEQAIDLQGQCWPPRV
jgi:hypothetical protein